MPETHVSILDAPPAGGLLPGESHLTLVRNSYYGMVDVGENATSRIPTPRAVLARIQREVSAGVHVLDGDEQNHVEVLTGKRLQQRAPLDRDDLPPVDLPAPVLTSLEPSTAVLGSPNFDIHVKGTDFAEGCVIVFAGQDEPTTMVSPEDVFTGVNMDVWQGPDPGISVLVRNPDGVESNALTFSFTAAAAQAASAPKKAATADYKTDTKKS